jgi:integrase
VEEVLQHYEEHLAEKGNKKRSVIETARRLRIWHEDVFQPVSDVTPNQLKKRYQKRSKEVSADTHRNELSEVKTFWNWCAKNNYVTKSPAQNIEPVGRRRKGKKQLRRNEAAQFSAKAIELAQAGDEGAVAVLAALTLGLRSSEILARKVRDVDEGKSNVLLWIEDGKTEAATRHMEVPPPLSGYLVRKAADKSDDDWLFPADSESGHRSRTWLLRNVKRLCKAAGVPVVCVHGLRGTWATMATDAGTAAHVVARELGHTNPEVTRQHYTKRGATERAKARRVLKVVEGGMR